MKKSLLHLHIAVFIWGFTGILGRAITLTAPVMVWYRMLLTTLILGLIITFRKEWQKIGTKDLLKLFGIGILFSIHWISFFSAVKFANASVAMICLATSSGFTVLLSALFKREKINYKELIISLVALLGVYCIYALQPQGAAQNNFVNYRLGVLLGLLASLISAIFTLFNKPLTQKYHFRNMVFYEMASGFVFLCLLSYFYVSKHPDVELIPQHLDFLWLFILAYCCTVWGQSLAMNALRLLTPFTVTLTVNLEPIYGIIIAFITYHENKELGYGFYIGCFLVFISIFLNSIIQFIGKKVADTRTVIINKKNNGK